MPIKTFIRFLISFSLVLLLIYQFDVTKAILTLSESKLEYIVLALAVSLGNVIFSAYRMRTILDLYNYKSTVQYLLKIYLLGNFYNNFLPTQVGGDVYKAVRLSKDLSKEYPDEKTHLNTISAFTVFMDRFSGLLILYVIGLVGVTISFGLVGLFIAVFALLSAVLGYYFSVKYLSKKSEFFSKFKEVNKMMLTNRSKIAEVFVWALIVQLFGIFTQIFCFYALSINVDILKAFMYLPIITILGLIPSINGLGIQDISYVYFFRSLGVAGESILAVSFMYHIVRFGISLIGGLLILRENMRYDKKE